MVKFVISICLGCELTASNTTKKVIMPIVSKQCLERIQIDLMDFCAAPTRSTSGSCRSRITFHTLCDCIRSEISRPQLWQSLWLIGSCICEYPHILQNENGGEFKGEILKLFDRVKVRVVSGAPYSPSIQGLVESTNRTFKD